MKTFLVSLGLIVLLILSAGCASSEPQPNISEQNMTIEEGVIESVRKIETRNSGVGTMIGSAVGSVAGSVAGSNVGTGTGRILSSVLGSVLGSIAGGTVGNNMSKNYSQELTIQLNNEKTTKVVLKIDDKTPELIVGQKVNIFSYKGKISKVTGR